MAAVRKELGAMEERKVLSFFSQEEAPEGKEIDRLVITLTKKRDGRRKARLVS